MTGASAAAADLADPADGADDRRRFSGIERLYGRPAAARIARAHVVVVGIGGVGSWAAEALARSGVGRLSLIDLDHVAESNLNRQVHATEASIGQAKVLAMRERIAGIHPGCRVDAIDDFVEPGNWPALLPDEPDAVIDACDAIGAKLAIAAWALGGRFRLIVAGAAGGKREPQRVAIDDLARVTHDPLLARLRNRLRREHGAPGQGRAIGLPCVYSAESVAPPDPSCAIDASDGSLNCHGFGSSVTVTATFGFCAAGWVLSRLAAEGK